MKQLKLFSLSLSEAVSLLDDNTYFSNQLLDAELTYSSYRNKIIFNSPVIILHVVEDKLLFGLAVKNKRLEGNLHSLIPQQLISTGWIDPL